MEKYGKARQATDNNIITVRDKYGVSTGRILKDKAERLIETTREDAKLHVFLTSV